MSPGHEPLAVYDRDEVLAEWLIDVEGKPQLHLFCHISSNQKWAGPIPPALRSIVFQKEMPLVRLLNLVTIVELWFTFLGNAHKVPVTFLSIPYSSVEPVDRVSLLIC